MIIRYSGRTTFQFLIVLSFAVTSARAQIMLDSLMADSLEHQVTSTGKELESNFPILAHPEYDYLDRAETAGRVAMAPRSRPYLLTVRRALKDSPTMLPREDDRFLGEGRASNELSRGVPRPQTSAWTRLRTRVLGSSSALAWVYQTGYYFGALAIRDRFSQSNFAVSFQPVYGFEYIDTDDDRGTISRLTSGARFEGGYADRLRFMMDFRDHTESGNGPYTSRSQLYEDHWASVDLKGKSSASYDISESFIQYHGHNLSLAAGRGRFYWGPAQFGSLFLNSSAPPFDYVRFDAMLEDRRTSRAVYYTFLHGFLESRIPAETLYVNPDGRPRTINAQKYFSAQRVEIRPLNNLLFGFSQGVVYGDRGLQLGYLTPLNFLYSVQHSNDDKDNLMIGMDGTWRVVEGFTMYGEALFDDIVVGDLTKSTGNNKSAYTVGAHMIVPRPFWSRFDVKAEYTKIRPFVYSHIFPVNTYSDWYSPLGYTREPNSEFMTAEIRGTFYPVQIAAYASRQNHGSSGGDINQPNYEGNDRVFPFLAGDVTHTSRIGLRSRWEMLPNLFLLAAAERITKSNMPARTEWHGGFAWNL